MPNWATFAFGMIICALSYECKAEIVCIHPIPLTIKELAAKESTGVITHQAAELNASYLISKYCDRIDGPLEAASSVPLGGGCEMKWGSRLGETVYWATCDTAPALSGSALVTAMQKELNRVGCDPGPTDGVWGNHTKRAMERFDRFSKLSVPADTPTMQALTALKGNNKKVCPGGSRPNGSSQWQCCLQYYRGERSLEGWGPAERCRNVIAALKLRGTKMDWCAGVRREENQRRTGAGCKYVVATYRKLLASGQMDYNSDAARYFRRQCKMLR